jgi:hypothetical protein
MLVLYWNNLDHGAANPLTQDLCRDAELTVYLAEQEIRHLMTASFNMGDAQVRARALGRVIREIGGH